MALGDDINTMRICIEVSEKRPGREPYSSLGYGVRIETPVLSGRVADLHVLADQLRAQAEHLVNGWFAARLGAPGTGT